MCLDLIKESKIASASLEKERVDLRLKMAVIEKDLSDSTTPTFIYTYEEALDVSKDYMGVLLSIK